MNVGAQQVIPGKNVAGVAGGEQHRDRWLLGAGPVGQVGALDPAGHHDIGEDQLGQHARLQHVHRLVAVFGGEHGVARLLEQLDDRHAHVFVVFDHQHRLMPVGRQHRFGVGVLALFTQVAREIHLHHGALALFAPHVDMPAALAHETEHHAQAKAGAVATALGGEERFEHPRQDRRRHAHADIRDRKAHILTRLDAFTHALGRVENDIFAGDANHALALHGITGIDRQVEQRVFQLVAVDVDAPGILGQLHVDMDGLAQRALQQLAQACVDALRVVHRR